MSRRTIIKALAVFVPLVLACEKGPDELGKLHSAIDSLEATLEENRRAEERMRAELPFTDVYYENFQADIEIDGAKHVRVDEAETVTLSTAGITNLIIDGVRQTQGGVTF